MSSDISGPQSVSDTGLAELLVLRTSPPRERADAARNRAAVLDAAARLFRAHGVAGVSMDAIAAAAGVGKGTLFRRFGDKAGLGVALLDTRERDLQQAILSGPAPLGPGEFGQITPPRDRLVAFIDAYLDYVLDNLDLVRMSETAASGARYRIGAYRFWHRHVAMLLHAEAPDRDAEALAHMLLAATAADHLTAVVAELGPGRARAAIHTLVTTMARQPGKIMQ